MFEGKRAVGVRYSKGGKGGTPVEVRAAKEVILAGGTYNSPQLLQLSGVGSPSLLQSLGIKVRHALDVSVVTSCRLDGRAAGGAADTMRQRRDMPDAECDADLEPALPTLRRAIMRGLLRRALENERVDVVMPRLARAPDVAGTFYPTFSDAWNAVCDRRQDLKQRKPLRPSDLPRQIAIARLILNHLRMSIIRTDARDDRSPHVESPALAGSP